MDKTILNIKIYNNTNNKQYTSNLLKQKEVSIMSSPTSLKIILIVNHLIYVTLYILFCISTRTFITS